MAAKRPEPDDPVLHGIDGLDRLLEHRLRLAICVLLSRFDAISFSRMKTITEETDGNLGANLRKLETAGYLRVRKEFVGGKPVSSYSLTPAGRRALRAHLAALSAVISQAGD